MSAFGDPMFDQRPRRQPGAIETGIGLDHQRAIVDILVKSAGQNLQLINTIALRKSFAVPARVSSGRARFDPDLEQTGFVILEILFAVHDTATGAHHLNIACFGPACIAHIIAMGNGALTDIGDDFHILMAVHRKAGLRCNLIIIPYPDRAKTHAGGIPIFAKGKMMAGLQPVMIDMGQLSKFAFLDHCLSPVPAASFPLC